MLTAAENEELTQVGPGTPGGELLRRYWHPICVAAELTTERPMKRVRLLGEDLVLAQHPDGWYGLYAERCAHRGASLYYGFLENGGIRCPYHGWLYGQDGHCIEQPFEPAQSMMKYTTFQRSYPVQRMAGLLFAYLGPLPAPYLPLWDVIARPDGVRKIQVQPSLNCNWLQCQENSLDPVHVYYLHGHSMVKHGVRQTNMYRPIREFAFEQIPLGIVKKRIYGGDGAAEMAEPGHPAVFPNMLRHWMEGRDGSNVEDGTAVIDMHFRIPVDDHNTAIIYVEFRPSSDGSWTDPAEEEPTVEYLKTLKDENGEFTMKIFPSQDGMAWETQGLVAPRVTERLGATDAGIVMWRKLLKDQIDAVRDGRDPIGVFRDAPGVITFSPARVLSGDRFVAAT